MNIENLNRVADAMEKHKFKWLGYNQAGWLEYGDLPDRSGQNCKTTACLAGWARAVERGDLEVDYNPSDAAEFLGLSKEEEKILFYFCPMGGRTPTSADAVAVLRYAAKHGVIDWIAACANNKEA